MKKHGICVGGGAVVLAAAKPEFPAYVSHLVVEGLFATFLESFKLHMKAEKRPIFPVLYEIFWAARLESGMKIREARPIRVIGKVKTPILFLHGRKDAFSLPKRAEALYAACNAPKELVWMDEGSHSHLRINNQELYDGSIKAFLQKTF